MEAALMQLEALRAWTAMDLVLWHGEDPIVLKRELEEAKCKK